jgi:uncharacterized repeat protein (TIGR02543 family)
VFSTKRVYNDLNLYEQWTANTYTITWVTNYTGGETFTWKREYGSKLGTLPVVSRLGYTQNGWWTSTTSGNNVTSETSVSGDATYYAHWNKAVYSISYDLRNGSWPAGANIK